MISFEKSINEKMEKQEILKTTLYTMDELMNQSINSMFLDIFMENQMHWISK